MRLNSWLLPPTQTPNTPSRRIDLAAFTNTIRLPTNERDRRRQHLPSLRLHNIPIARILELTPRMLVNDRDRSRVGFEPSSALF
jgi:hypothetical protein